MSKNVAVFVDVANIFYAAKAAGVDIDYVTLLKSAIAGRDFVRAYAYTGLDPENENQRNFHDFLRRHGYKVVSKDIRKYGDGKVKANLDIELVVDMLKTARNLDVAIVVSGDGDFAPAIRAVQEMGVRVEVISFRGNTSSDLIEVADLFTDIAHIAKVEKGTRSGRRVSEDEEDLSMTEVPEKQTEGATRGRGRGRGRASEPEVAPATAAEGRTGRGRRGRATTEAVAASSIVALPGEKLSKLAAGAATIEPVPAGEDVSERESEAPVASGGGEPEMDGEERRRRRRRRGGRGRGRGRGSEAELQSAPVGDEAAEDADEEIETLPAPRRGPRPTPFGSVWDSQIGMGVARPSPAAPIGEDEFEEPEIPEYLIAEQRRGSRGGRGGGVGRGSRGVRGAYAAALERERYGGGRGGGTSRFGEGDRGGRAQPQPQPQRRVERPATGGSGRPGPGRPGEPWSEVPPELEEMLRAQLAGKVAQRSAPSAAPAPEVSTAEAKAESAPKRRAPRARKSEPAAATTAAAPAPEVSTAEAKAEAAPKRRAPRATRAKTSEPSA